MVINTPVMGWLFCLVIDCEAREIEHLVAPVCPSVRLSVHLWMSKFEVKGRGQRSITESYFSTGAEWSMMILCFAMYTSPMKPRETPRKIHTPFTPKGLLGIQSGCTFRGRSAFNFNIKLLFEPTSATCTVGSYASFSVCSLYSVWTGPKIKA